MMSNVMLFGVKMGETVLDFGFEGRDKHSGEDLGGCRGSYLGDAVVEATFDYSSCGLE